MVGLELALVGAWLLQVRSVCGQDGASPAVRNLDLDGAVCVELDARLVDVDLVAVRPVLRQAPRLGVVSDAIGGLPCHDDDHVVVWHHLDVSDGPTLFVTSQSNNEVSSDQDVLVLGEVEETLRGRLGLGHACFSCSEGK